MNLRYREGAVLADLFCGIDFGTSNSTVALADRGRAWLIPLEGGEVTLPSAVFWEVDGPPGFGRAAISSYIDGVDGRLMRALKSTLSSALIDERTVIGNKSVTFKAILTAYFRHLVVVQHAECGPLTKVILGRPVHFVDGDPAADLRAQTALEEIARALGFAEVGFQFEPIAAALHYEQSVQSEELVLIVDIGGGTSDFSIVRVGPERAKAADRGADILANDGIRVGGTDFDRLLSLAQLLPHLGYLAPTKGGLGTMPRHYYLDLASWHRINFLYNQRVAADLKALRLEAVRPELIDRMMKVVAGRHGHALAMAVETAKIALSVVPAARMMVSDLTGGPNPLVRREDFETAVEAPLQRIADTIAAILQQAGLSPERIGTVFMTGGSSGLPILGMLVAAALPQARIATGDMLGSVGTGLALEARRRFG
jgi:hypothetical chaperone protein